MQKIRLYYLKDVFW